MTFVFPLVSLVLAQAGVSSQQGISLPSGEVAPREMQQIPVPRIVPLSVERELVKSFRKVKAPVVFDMFDPTTGTHRTYLARFDYNLD